MSVASRRAEMISQFYCAIGGGSGPAVGDGAQLVLRRHVGQL